MDRPITTLFLLMSLDGKITTGSNDALDFDNDLRMIKGIKEGLHQYYKIEQTTDLWSLNTGRVLVKTGINEKNWYGAKVPVSFVVIDNKHLNEHGITYLCDKLEKVVIVTSNKEHPGFRVSKSNLSLIYQDTQINLERALNIVKSNFKCERLTIQSGGTLNSELLRKGLIDYLDIVVAPLIVGGKHTSTLVDGEDLKRIEDLNKLVVLKLESMEKLEDSYIRLRYTTLGSESIE